MIPPEILIESVTLDEVLRYVLEEPAPIPHDDFATVDREAPTTPAPKEVST